MKTSLLSIASAFVLLFSAGSLATAAPLAKSVEVARHDDKKYNDDRRLSAKEKARLEAARREDARREALRREEARREELRREELRREAARRNDRKYDRQDDRNAQDFNYGYAKNHRVTAAEKARWEAQHGADRH